jgi:serine/threonine protein kinase
MTEEEPEEGEYIVTLPPPPPSSSSSSSSSYRKYSRRDKLQQLVPKAHLKHYQAIDLEHISEVAVKVCEIKRANSAGFPLQLLREIKLLQSLDHKHIVPLITVLAEEHGAIDYHSAKPVKLHLVFPLLDHDLAGILKNPDIPHYKPGHKLAPEHVRYYMKGITEGLAYLHQQNIIHRDLKSKIYRYILVASSIDFSCKYTLVERWSGAHWRLWNGETLSKTQCEQKSQFNGSFQCGYAVV